MKKIILWVFIVLLINQIAFPQQGGTLAFEYTSVVKYQNSPHNSENIYLYNYEGKPLKALQFKIRIENFENHISIESLTNGFDIPKSNFLFDYEIHNLDELGKSIIIVSAVILGNGYTVLQAGEKYHLASLNYNIDHKNIDSNCVKFSLIDVMGATSSPVQDANIVAGRALELMVKQSSDVVELVTLNQNYPNPFNPITIIKYSIKDNDLKALQKIELRVFDALGNQITTLVDEVKTSGNYEIEFDASNLASGIYFYSINSGKTFVSKKMMLMK
jgi:hypothetical protein